MLGSIAQLSNETQAAKEVGRPEPLPIFSAVVLVPDLVQKVLSEMLPG